MRRGSTAISILGLVLALQIAKPTEARAQEFPIAAAIMLIGGGIAVAIGNGVRAANERPPKELWDDAGWALGIVNVLAGVGFAVTLTRRVPADGALPIAIGLGTIGIADLGMTAWAVSYQDPEPDEWEGWEERWREQNERDAGDKARLSLGLVPLLRP